MPCRSSTGPTTWTFEGKVQTLQNKTLRWKGHFEQWKAIMNARGVTPRGVKPVEVAVPAKPFIDELRRRGFALTEQVTFR